MAVLSGSLYPGAQQARMLSGAVSSPETVIQALVAGAIRTAVAAGLFTCTASMASKTTQDVQNQMRILKAQGYTVSLSGTTLTVSW